MQGIFINGKRPKTKKEVKEAIKTAPESVTLEVTSVFGNEYGGPLEDAPAGSYMTVGPDPRTSRKFYCSIMKFGSGKVTVK